MSLLDLDPARLRDMLQIDGDPATMRVVVAMSGGVDSSVAAALVAKAGFQTAGITLQLYDQGEVMRRKGACCAGQDIYDAKTVADRLGIAHYVLDYESHFKDQVIQDFADAYARGETPIPCVRCNERVKFADLLKTAKDLGAAALVTGHYVQRIVGPDGPELHRAADSVRDQSYFLFTTTRAQLDFLRFPLGGIPKSETRAVAEAMGLVTANKPDSQDICFVPDGDYASIVRRVRPDAAEPGDIVHLDGRVLGRHAGVINFTVGQRRGLEIAAPDPLYVVSLDAKTRRIVVGPRAALASRHVPVKDLNWIGPRAPTAEPMSVAVKIRSMRPPVAAEIASDGQGGATATLLNPQEAIAPGQACVIYDADTQSRLLGGGWIARAERGQAA